MSILDRMWLVYTKKLIARNIKERVDTNFTHRLLQLVTKQYGFDALDDVYDVYIDSLVEHQPSV